ncbi:MAG: hypothetical protein HQK49_06015 [Oligoflexia bacterium]|nr:hypothetical protein [Oligoflexia bacterium]
MKKLIITMKPTSDMFNDFINSWKQLEKNAMTNHNHYEISFENRKDYERFVKNVHILILIVKFKPKSVYELSKISQMDLANLKKIIKFFVNIGAIHIKEKTVNGKHLKMPIIDYSKIEFDLAA